MPDEATDSQHMEDSNIDGIQWALTKCIGKVLNKATLDQLMTDLRLATPGMPSLLPSDLASSEVRVQVETRTSVYIGELKAGRAIHIMASENGKNNDD